MLAGLYNFVTTLDTNGLNAVLPKNRDLTMQNVVGVQMLGWGLGLLFAPEWLTSNIMGGKVSPGVEINQCVGCTAMTRPCWLCRAVRNWHTATPSRHRVDGVEVDATIQHERAVKF